MGLFDKRQKTYSIEGSVKDVGGRTTKTYRKDGSLKSSSNVNFSGYKSVPVSGFTGANSRFMKKTEDTVLEKTPATGSRTSYNRKGEVKKTKSIDNARGTGINLDLYQSQTKSVYRERKNAQRLKLDENQSTGATGATAMGVHKGATAYNKGPHAQTSAERYAENAESDIKTGEGTKADIAYDIKKASEKGYKEGATAYMDGPMAYSSADKVHRNRRGVTAMRTDSTTDEGIKGLGSKNKSGGKYI